MAMTAQEWTISGLSVELGMDRRTLAKRLSDVTPVREAGKSQYYRMKDVVEAVFVANAPAGSLEEERTRLTKAQADKTELEVAVMRGSLIPAGTVEEVWSKMLGAFRARCLSIPTKASHAVLAVADLTEAELVLKDYVHEALSELAEYDGSQYGARPDKPVGEDSSASTSDGGKRVGRRSPDAEQRGERGAGPLEH
jgi:phage terminase Nu1 subunit (DNA packaging protein)